MKFILHIKYIFKEVIDMVYFALKMNDLNWFSYICFCLENGLKPCEVKNLKEYQNYKVR